MSARDATRRAVILLAVVVAVAAAVSLVGRAIDRDMRAHGLERGGTQQAR